LRPSNRFVEEARSPALTGERALQAHPERGAMKLRANATAAKLAVTDHAVGNVRFRIAAPEEPADAPIWLVYRARPPLERLLLDDVDIQLLCDGEVRRAVGPGFFDVRDHVTRERARVVLRRNGLRDPGRPRHASGRVYSPTMSFPATSVEAFV